MDDKYKFAIGCIAVVWSLQKVLEWTLDAISEDTKCKRVCSLIMILMWLSLAGFGLWGAITFLPKD